MLALVLDERHTETIISLMDRWIDEGVDLHAPLLAQYEIANTLTGKRAREEITAAKADTALAAIDNLVMTFDVTPNNARVIEIALEMQRHKAYDAYYLELGERLDASLWTLDRPIANNEASRHRVTLIE